ncbi:MAG TPA: 2-C-methyl-D-erythritol 4-phosphate cytidylyltransferase [Thermoleophilaceae bacterium]|nr:2-C-methyl-D-erythritol 4-phosphate cytidylyltransferase [Thermoleophilaceae bacterium]
MATVVGIVPAGGSGERLGADRPKAFVVLAGKTLLERSVEALRPVCDRVVVAVPAGEESGADRVAGGPSRSASVRNALAAAPEAEIAVVHDAARPLATPELARRCVEALEPGVEGAIAAAPLTDTVKEASPDGRVVRTLDRTALWAVQTPQAFRADALRRALDVGEDALAAATDDASLVEAAGGIVRIVEAPPENLKVTRQADLELAEAILGC